MKLVYKAVEDQLKINHRSTIALLVIKFLVYLVLVAFFYILIYTTSNPFLFFLVFVLYGFSAVLFGFNYAHDFSHNTVFKNKQLNNAGFVFIYTLLGAHAEAWKYRHVHSHHYAPNVKDYDSDLQITSLIRVEPNSEWRWYHRFQHWYAPLAYMTYSLYWVFIKDFVIYFSDESSPNSKTFLYHLSFWLQKITYFGYLLVLPVFFSGFAWYIVLAAFLLMHFIQSLFLLFTFFMTHHVEATEYFSADEEGYIRASWFMNQVKSSNDFYPFSKTANFIFGGFNNHVAHHLFPHIHHVHYPELNRILYRELKQNNIEPNVTGFFTGVASHLAHLKNLSHKPVSYKHDLV
jgi:linoleoyl-CoA desaturase